MQSWALWVTVSAMAWALWAAAAHALLRHSARPGDALGSLASLFVMLYARLWHRMRVEGRENVPRGPRPGPLILVSNHTAGVDPLLIQSVCPFEITWVMAEDMRIRKLDDLWRWLGVIFVDRGGERPTGVRAALETLRAGGVIGLFPEGRIERPARTLLPFQPGVAMLAGRSDAPILPVLVDGAAQTDSAWGSLWRRGRARVRFMAAIGPAERPTKGRDLAAALQRRYQEWTGWPSAGADGRDTSGGVSRAAPEGSTAPAH